MTPVNTTPTIPTVPAPQTINEDNAAVDLGTIVVADEADDFDNDTNVLTSIRTTMLVTIVAPNGKLTLGTATGVTVVGSGTSTMTLQGTITALNTALKTTGTTGVKYQPNPNYYGVDTVTINANDLGNVGGPSNKTAQATVAITVRAINDDPAVTAPATENAREDSKFGDVNVLVFSVLGGNAITILDPLDDPTQIGTGDYDVTLVVTPVSGGAPGALKLAGTAGLTSVSGDSTASIALKGTLAEINAALNGLKFQPDDPDNAGQTLNLHVLVHDNNNIADPFFAPIDRTAFSDTLITVTQVNDEPTVMLLPDESVKEDSGLRTVMGFATLVPDASPPGDMSENPQTVVVYTVTNNNNALFSQQPSIDAMTGTLTYTPSDDVNGVATVSVIVKDNGGTMDFGDDTSTAVTFTITVRPVNDAPTVLPLANQSVVEDSGTQVVLGFATLVEDASLPGRHEQHRIGAVWGRDGYVDREGASRGDGVGGRGPAEAGDGGAEAVASVEVIAGEGRHGFWFLPRRG